MKEEQVHHSTAGKSRSAWPVSLWVPAVLSLGGYILISLWFPLFPAYNHSPLADIRTFAPTLAAALAYGGLFTLLYFLYGLSYRLISRRQELLSLGQILLAGLLFALPLIFTFPVNATDIYRYFIRGRITAVHQQSPYLVTAADLGEAEPYLPLAGEWAGNTSPYGPLWEALAAALTALTPDNLGLALLLFKGTAVLGHLAVGGLVWLSLAGYPAPFRAGRTLLWVWNPALLMIFAADGHNDSLMLLWLALGWWMMSRKRPQLAMLLFFLAALSKPIGLLALPIFFLAALRQTAGLWPRVRFTLLTAVSGLGLLWAAFLPFGPPLSLARRLIVEAGSGGEFSFLALFFLAARQAGYNIITAEAIQLASRLAAALFVLFALWLFWRTWRGRSPLRGAADIFAAYIVQSFVFRIWYTAWPFPWLLLDAPEQENKSRAAQSNRKFLTTAEGRMAAGFWFLYTAHLSVLIYGQIRAGLLQGMHSYAHFIGVPFTFLLPLLLAALAFRSGIVTRVIGAFAADTSHSHERQIER